MEAAGGSPCWEESVAWGRAGLQPISPLNADVLTELAGH